MPRLVSIDGVLRDGSTTGAHARFPDEPVTRSAGQMTVGDFPSTVDGAPERDGVAAPTGTAPTNDDTASTAPNGQEILEHVSGLRRYALMLVGDTSNAEDLVQECILRVIAQARGWRPVRDLRAYLFTTLHNIFVDGHRRKKTRSKEVPIENVAADLVALPRQTKWLEVRDLIAALRELPVEQRQVVLLVGLEGMSYQDTANILKIPVGTVMSRLSRGREALRQLTTTGTSGKLRLVR